MGGAPEWPGEAPSSALTSITARDLEAHITFLASDALEGRGTATRGLRAAAEYVVSQFQRGGAAPWAGHDRWLQPFDLIRVGPLESGNRLTYTRGGARRVFVPPDDFRPYHMTANRRITASVVFAGYGISAPSLDYDDYAHLDVRDRIVLILTGTPDSRSRPGRLDRIDNAQWYGTLQAKVRLAARLGATGMLVATAPLSDTATRHSPRPPRNTIFPTPETVDEVRPRYLLPDHLPGILVAHLSRVAADALLDDSGSTLLDLQTLIDSLRTPRSFVLPDLQITLETAFATTRVRTQNVIARVEGSDAVLREEVVLIMAHYDHKGRRGGTIYPGADDNASGTAAVLEIAEAFATAEALPQRSVVFSCFSGEEQGLLGSQFFLDSGRLPPGRIVAVLNLDMIGRNAPGTVHVVGSDFRSTALHRLNAAMAARLSLTVDARYNSITHRSRLFFRSDHYHFARLGIPFIFYTGGMHGDYHRPTDTADRINFYKAESITRLAFSVAWHLADGVPIPRDRRVGMDPAIPSGSEVLQFPEQ